MSTLCSFDYLLAQGEKMSGIKWKTKMIQLQATHKLSNETVSPLITCRNTRKSWLARNTTVHSDIPCCEDMAEMHVLMANAWIKADRPGWTRQVTCDEGLQVDNDLADLVQQGLLVGMILFTVHWVYSYYVGASYWISRDSSNPTSTLSEMALCQSQTHTHTFKLLQAHYCCKTCMHLNTHYMDEQVCT